MASILKLQTNANPFVTLMIFNQTSIYYIGSVTFVEDLADKKSLRKRLIGGARTRWSKQASLSFCFQRDASIKPASDFFDPLFLNEVLFRIYSIGQLVMNLNHF